MPFVRTKRIGGVEYYYLIESYREDGKPRQRVLAYLGAFATVQAALRYWQKQASAGLDAAARKHARTMVKKLTPYL
jgi:hypothetical protein